ncbi:MAG: hypothetical protein MOB07_09050 [Acidobacteria bacterium]|nr:hypothetical protein [Acidobacteriota bacterium]
MLIFPITTETFKKSFLSGDGEIELQSDQDIWLTLIATGGKFLPNINRVASVNFKFGNEGKFRFGREGAMRLSVGASAGHEIRLIWHDEDDETLKALGLNEFLTEEKLYARLFFKANADLAADAKFPVGTLSATFGIGAGGGAAYERLKSYDAEKSAKEILGDLLAGARLPQQVDSVSEIPEPGEALITQFGGYLKLYELYYGDSPPASSYGNAIDEARRSPGILLFAYAIMPDHMHLLTDQPDNHLTYCVISKAQSPNG